MNRAQGAAWQREGRGGSCDGRLSAWGGTASTHPSLWSPLGVGEANLTRTLSRLLAMQSPRSHSRLNRNLLFNKVPR